VCPIKSLSSDVRDGISMARELERPHSAWTIIHDDMSSLDLGIHEARDLAQNRPLGQLTQPCIPPGSLNRVPASAGVRAGMPPQPGGR